ncbi:hypothetical protein CYY_002543 [Polysphondylium violaceum]|uniref:Ankyrin repeat-containing protein n=1 Tax=Polysphondylium violaceum TaxID=133409 RepID=A0A8J4Q7S4_9MYCE|nr:hypothetical protein CYY_002543 [Polysphondylium violaceum]
MNNNSNSNNSKPKQPVINNTCLPTNNNNNNINNNTNQSLFTILIKNKYIFNIILGYCKYSQDVISYNYFELPIRFICKIKRFDIFDEKWKKSMIDQNTVQCDINLVLDIDEQAVIEFLVNNTSFERFCMVWNYFYPILRHKQELIDHSNLSLSRLHSEILVYVLKANGADHRILDVILTNYKPDKYLNSTSIFYALAYRGCIATFELVLKQFPLIVKEIKFLIGVMIECCKFKNNDLAKHIYATLLFDKDVSFEVGDYTENVLEYMLESGADLELSKLPPKNLSSIPFILNNSFDSGVLELDYQEASMLGNKQLLDYMISLDCEIRSYLILTNVPNVEILELFMEKFPRLNWDLDRQFELSIKNNKPIVQYLHQRGFKFCSYALDANYDTLEFILSNYCLPTFNETEFTNNYHKDIRIVKLLYHYYGPSVMTQFSLINGVYSGNLEIVKFFLTNGIGIVNQFLLEISIFNPPIYYYLLDNLNGYDSTLLREHMKKYIRFNGHQFILRAIESLNYAALDLIREQTGVFCLLEFSSAHSFKVKNLLIPNIYKAILQGHQDCIKRGITLLPELSELIEFGLKNTNIKFLRFLVDIIKNVYPGHQVHLDVSKVLGKSMIDRSFLEIYPVLNRKFLKDDLHENQNTRILNFISATKDSSSNGGNGGGNGANKNWLKHNLKKAFPFLNK